MRRRGVTVALAAATVVALLAVGTSLLPRLWRADGTDPVSLPPAEPAFAASEVTWAQGSTIHYGEQTFDVSPWLVRSMLRTSYGFVLEVSRAWGFDRPTRTMLYDGSSLTDLPGDIRTAKVSPDGRYVGWIDYAGPDLGNGRVGQAVVVDLRTGHELLRTHEGMAGDSGIEIAEQYAEGGPAFLGFDRSAAYWLDVRGNGHRWRLDLATGEIGDLGEGGPDVPVRQRLGDSVRGFDANHHDGRPPEESIVTGFLSPDQRWLFRTELTGRVPVEDPGSGQDLTPDYGYPWLFFGGWQGPDRFYVLARRHFDLAVAPRPDRSRGVLLSCTLPSGDCEELEQVRSTNTLVFGYGATSVFEGL